ncbi:FecR family protein [Fulvivirga imtechensis]|nr:FecR domain-containing protein [Fulvivirga imtechensis]
MRSDKQHWKRLAAYLSGHLNDAEKSDVEEWKNSSTENKRVFNESRKVWENSSMRLRLSDDDTEQEWDKLKLQLEKGPSGGGKVVQFFAAHSRWISVAASILLVAGAFYIFWPSDNTVTAPIVAEAVVTFSAGNEVATIYLPDSSKVWLNVGSTITYPESFGDKLRSTQISGEAYFMVRPDTSAPFTVSTELASVRVLGTSFNVKEDSAGVVLTVAEGTVSFSAMEADSSQAVVVMANEKAVATGKGVVSKSANDNPRFAAWRTVNNPAYEYEKNNARSFLINNYTWEKNKLNMSVIDGVIENRAELATFTNIVLKMSYTKPNGKISVTRFKVMDTLEPGQMLPYQKRLFDIFTDTKKVKVEIETVDVIVE